MKPQPFKKSDKLEVIQLFTKVFSDSEGQSEGELIGDLVLNLIDKTAPQDIFGYVAVEKDQIIGCIFFTRLSFESPVKTFILAPVAIHTDHQGQGIGQKLINFGISQIKEKGIELIFTYGDPNYYSKVGFESITEDIAKAPFELSQPEGWLCQSLIKSKVEPLPGKPRCVEAFNKPAYW